MELKDRTVWLIGGSSGIGAALAPQLAARGARLALSARRVDELRQLAERSSRPGRPALFKPLDVTDRSAVERVARELRDEWGRIDVLIYGAGAWTPMNVEQFDVDAFERQIDVNYAGMVRAIGAVMPDMVQRRHGEIVGIASLSAYGGLPRAEAYGSTKAAVNYLLQSLRMDLRTYNVGVTTVNPGFVRTGLTADNDFPMPFLMDVDDAARAIVRGLVDGRPEIHFPLRLSLPLKAFTALPRPIYEWIVSRTVKR